MFEMRIPCRRLLPLVSLLLFSAVTIPAYAGEEWRAAWPKTNFEKRTVDLSSIQSGGPPRDGIPSIDRPRFVSAEEASSWVAEREPVLFLSLRGEKRAYPLQILIWHEIVNDVVSGLPVTVTFCPLCYSGIAFDRRLDGQVLEFGVSGLLRHRDMVMYDRQTESLWQQLTGEAIVGDMVGRTLKMIPVSLISFGQVVAEYPEAQVLSKETGYLRNYGENPYAGYDDIDKTPVTWKYQSQLHQKVPPMEHLITVLLNGEAVGYPFFVLRRRPVIEDEIGGVPVVIFFEKETATALDAPQVQQGRATGAGNVFKRELEGRTLSFAHRRGTFVDRETGSTWNMFGVATSGPLEGKRLEQVVSGDFFAFAWLVFRPETRLYLR